MRFQSVRARLTLWNVAVLAIVLVVLGLVLRFTLQQSLLDGVDARLRRIAAPVARQVSSGDIDRSGPDPPGPPPPEGGMGQPPGPLPVGPGSGAGQGRPGDVGPGIGGGGDFGGGARPPARTDGDHGGQPNGEMGGQGPMPPPRPRPRRMPPGDYPPRLLDLAGHPVGAYPGDPSGPYDRDLFSQSLAGKYQFGQAMYGSVLLRVYSAPVYRNGRLAAVIQTEQPLTDVVHGVDQLTRTLLLISPLALLIAGLSGSLLASRALRPVKQLIVTAEGIEAHDLGGRIPVVGTDEFAELSSTINGMFARLESSFSRQDEAIRQLRRFTADASHELRTPLTVIKANTSLALTGPDDIESYRLAMQEADWAADRMNAIVQDLLLLARSDDGSLAMTLNTVSVSDLVEQAVRLVARADTAQIETAPISPTLKVLADREAIERMIGNVLKNAQRHTPATGKIEISAEPVGDDIRITVSDNGEGIAPQHLPHVFDRFYRVDSARTRDRGGTGLGLPICKTIAEAHSGSIRIESILGAGTLVTMSLPSLAIASGANRNS